MKWIPYKKKKCTRILYQENIMTEEMQLQGNKITNQEIFQQNYQGAGLTTT